MDDCQIIISKKTFEKLLNQPTLRDQFAMAALTGLVSKYGSGDYMNASTIVYSYADAMLKARE